MIGVLLRHAGPARQGASRWRLIQQQLSCMLAELGALHAAIDCEVPMFATIVSISGADADKREQVIKMANDTIIPALRQYAGFAGEL